MILGDREARYLLFLTNLTTGTRREVAREAVWSPDSKDATEYQWTEGNYACDCNRGLFYDRAGGEPADETQDCGTERFVLTVQEIGGLVVYDEMERVAG